MTDQTIPTDQARRARQWARDTLDDVENGANVSAYARDAARTLIAMMPRPTLADMTAEERAACQWMQADVANHSVRYVIANPYDEDGDAELVSAEGRTEWLPPESITPRPDLARLTWPEATPTGPDHLAVGTVIESAADPRIAALPLGSILLDREGEAATKRRWEWTGLGNKPIPSQGGTLGPWTVLHIPKEEA